MDLHLKDKVALITGGSHGLGQSICCGLAAEGVKVAVNYRKNPERAEDVVKEIQERSRVEAMSVYGDLAKEADIVAMFRQVEARFGQIDILVNNAAMCPQSWVKDTPEHVWNTVLQVNLTGAFIACRELVNRLITANRPGRIVNIASVAAFHGSNSGQAAYRARYMTGTTVNVSGGILMR